MPKSVASLLRWSAQGSTIWIWLAGWPCFSRPPMMALAMLPPPMKAMVSGSGVLAGMEVMRVLNQKIQRPATG